MRSDQVDVDDVIERCAPFDHKELHIVKIGRTMSDNLTLDNLDDARYGYLLVTLCDLRPMIRLKLN